MHRMTDRLLAPRLRCPPCEGSIIVIVCEEVTGEAGSGSMAVWFDVGVHADRPETELVKVVN
jgi:hypothetical protein